MNNKSKRKNAIYWPIYFSWTRVKGGQRFHIPLVFLILICLQLNFNIEAPVWVFILSLLFTSLYVTRVENKTYLIMGLPFLECKVYFAPLPDLPEITSEEVMEKNISVMTRLLKRRGSVTVATLSKKLKISSSGVEQLARQVGYVVENGEVFYE